MTLFSNIWIWPFHPLIKELQEALLSWKYKSNSIFVLEVTTVGEKPNQDTIFIKTINP